MFAQGLISIAILLGFVWVLWTFVIKKVLIAHGIEVDEKKPIETEYTKELEKLEEEFEKMNESAQAAEKGALLKEEIEKLKNKINIYKNINGNL